MIKATLIVNGEEVEVTEYTISLKATFPGGAEVVIEPPYEIPPPSVQHISLYGQSLTLGSDPSGASVITTGGVAGSYMLNGGVRAHYDEVGISNVNKGVDQGQITSLVPLQDQINPNNSEMGETFASGIALRVTGDVVVSTAGRGAYLIDNLVPNNPAINTAWLHWSNHYAMVEASRQLAAAQELAWSYGPLVWKQGEADGAANTTRAAYKASMLDLHYWEVNSTGLAAQQDLSNHKIIIDQQALGFAGETFGEIAVAAIELHREYPAKFACTGPTYGETFTNINDVHMTSNNYRNYGEKLGQVIETINNGSAWNPCHITAASRSGTVITLTVYVPVAPLVFDTSFITAIANQGFTYTGANITGVAITDSGATDNTGTIEITLDAAAGGTLGYAYENNAIAQRIGPVLGPRGTVRDSDPYTTTNDGTAKPNRLCTDQWSIA